MASVRRDQWLPCTENSWFKLFLARSTTDVLQSIADPISHTWHFCENIFKKGKKYTGYSEEKETKEK